MEPQAKIWEKIKEKSHWGIYSILGGRCSKGMCSKLRHEKISPAVKSHPSEGGDLPLLYLLVEGAGREGERQEVLFFGTIDFVLHFALFNRFVAKKQFFTYGSYIL